MNVFDFAIDIERSGMEYFKRLSKKHSHAGIKRIFSMMAADEKKLMEKFQAMKASAQATMMEDSRALDTSTNVFTNLAGQDALALGLANDLDAYNYVMEIEREICRLYESAAAKETNTDAKRLLLKIAAEERRELESLNNIYDFVNAPNEFLAWGEFSNLGEFHNFGRDEG